MIHPIIICDEVNLHNPSLLPTLHCTLQCMGHTQKCIPGTQTFPISKLGSYRSTLLRSISSKTNRHQTLKHFRQHWCYENRLAIGNRGGGLGLWVLQWDDIGLSPASRKITQTNKPLNCLILFLLYIFLSAVPVILVVYSNENLQIDVDIDCNLFS